MLSPLKEKRFQVHRKFINSYFEAYHAIHQTELIRNMGSCQKPILPHIVTEEYVHFKFKFKFRFILKPGG